MPLPGTRQEVETIKPLIRGKREILVGAAPTRSAVLERLQTRSYRIIHLATHGVLPGDTSSDARGGDELDQPALVMAAAGGNFEDQLILSDDVFDLSLHSQLVVLSACRTGEGDRIRGEGVLGMGQAFLYAGADTVLMSLWAVDDEASAEWMTCFYEELAQHGDPSVAALEARRAIAAGGSRGDERAHWKAPMYWAPFVLTGSARSE